jgi:hypothetical protein
MPLRAEHFVDSNNMLTAHGKSWQKLAVWMLSPIVLALPLLSGCATIKTKPPGPPVPPSQPGMALHVQGKRFLTGDGKDPRILGTIIGCHIAGMSGWPLICNPSLDTIKAAGLNWSSLRTGPFTAEGEAPEFAFYEKAPNGKYDLTKINQAFLQLVRSKIIYAQSLGIYIEVDLPADRWVAQRPDITPWSAKNNLQGEEHGGLGIFQGTPDPVHLRALKAILRVTCDLDNVMYSTGNEAFKSDSAAWEAQYLVDIRACGYPHVIGANSEEGAPLADYTILHQSNAPTPQLRPVEVNEFGNDISPDIEINESIKADTYGTYFHYWGGNGPEWLATIKTLGQIRAGKPPAPTLACEIPAVEVPMIARKDPPFGTRPGNGPQIDGRDNFINEAEGIVKAEHPTLFDTNGNIAGWPSDGTQQAAAAQPYFNLLVSYFRSRGACASAWEDSVAVGWKGDGYFEENHVIAFRNGTPAPGRNAWRYTWQFPR